MKNHIHMMSNISRQCEAEFLADVFSEACGITLDEWQRVHMAYALITFFDALDRSTGFSWDDLPKVTDDLYCEPDAQLMLPFITPVDMKKWEALKKKHSGK